MKAIHFKRNLMVLSILLSMVSCNTLRVNKSDKIIAEDNVRYKTTFIDIDSNNTARYECEKFVLNALNNYSIESITKQYKFLKCTREPKINIHNPAIIDTIYTFTNKKNIIKVYRAQYKEFIFILDLTSSKFKLKGDIKPGMSKEAFCRKFNITELIDDKVQLANSDENMKYIFYFKQNKLKRISASLYLD